MTIIPIPRDMRQSRNGHQVAGVCVNTCVALSVKADFSDLGLGHAHAHTREERPFYGWVCFSSPKDLTRRKVRMHELAHVFTPGHGHSEEWEGVYKLLLRRRKG